MNLAQSIENVINAGAEARGAAIEIMAEHYAAALKKLSEVSVDIDNGIVANRALAATIMQASQNGSKDEMSVQVLMVEHVCLGLEILTGSILDGGFHNPRLNELQAALFAASTILIKRFNAEKPGKTAS